MPTPLCQVDFQTLMSPYSDSVPVNSQQSEAPLWLLISALLVAPLVPDTDLQEVVCKPFLAGKRPWVA